MVEKEGQKCLIIEGDLVNEDFCKSAVKTCIKEFKKLNIVVNNAAVQFPQDDITQISSKQLHKTFETNILSMFHITIAAIGYLKKGDVIINTSAVTAYRGSGHLIDYSSTKGAIVSFTRSLSANLTKKKSALMVLRLAQYGHP